MVLAGVEVYSQDSTEASGTNFLLYSFESSNKAPASLVSKILIAKAIVPNINLEKPIAFHSKNNVDTQFNFPDPKYQPVKLQRKNGASKGALIGFVAGVLIGIGFSISLNESLGGGSMPADGLIGFSFATGTGGALLGAGIGALAQAK